MGARVHLSPHNFCSNRTLYELFDVLRVACFTATSSRGSLSQPSRRTSSLADVRTVQDLPFRNNELADAVVKDRSMARIWLYERLMPTFEEKQRLQTDQLGLEKPRSAIQQSQLNNFEDVDIRTLLKPCVSRIEVLQGDEATLRLRLAAVLHFTGLHEQYPVDLKDLASIDAIAEEFESAAQAGMVLPYGAGTSTAPPPPKPSSWQAPVSLAEARRRTQMNCSQSKEDKESLVSVKDFASLLVDAGFEDVLSVNVAKLSDDRDFDVLMLATGRSPQHAFAGAKAVRYLLKLTRQAHGLQRPVQIAHDGVAAWFSVTSGPVSVHCMSREVREQLDLEELWGHGADLTWYQQGPPALTLDTIGGGSGRDAGGDSSGNGIISDEVHNDGVEGEIDSRQMSEGRGDDGVMQGSAPREGSR